MQTDNNAGPDRDSAEYLYEMAAKYRAQVDGPKKGPDFGSEYRESAVKGDLVSVRVGSTTGPLGEERYFSAAAADPGQLADLRREIAQREAMLAASHGYDQRTGEPQMQYQGRAREVIEAELSRLKTVTLPHAQARVAEAQAWRRENIRGPEDDLRLQAERKAAIRGRAQEIVDEREAQQEADRLIATRRASRGF